MEKRSLQPQCPRLFHNVAAQYEFDPETEWDHHRLCMRRSYLTSQVFVLQTLEQVATTVSLGTSGHEMTEHPASWGKRGQTATCQLSALCLLQLTTPLLEQTDIEIKPGE